MSEMSQIDPEEVLNYIFNRIRNFIAWTLIIVGLVLFLGAIVVEAFGALWYLLAMVEHNELIVIVGQIGGVGFIIGFVGLLIFNDPFDARLRKKRERKEQELEQKYCHHRQWNFFVGTIRDINPEDGEYKTEGKIVCERCKKEGETGPVIIAPEWRNDKWHSTISKESS